MDLSLPLVFSVMWILALVVGSIQIYILYIITPHAITKVIMSTAEAQWVVMIGYNHR